MYKYLSFITISAGSRSTSPSSRSSYLTHTGGAAREPMVTPKGKRRSGIPRSQGTSREASPSRATFGEYTYNLEGVASSN